MALGPDALSVLRAPTRIADLGLPVGLVEDLFMRRVVTERITTVGEASSMLGISHPVGDEVAENLREKNLLEYHGVEGRDYRISLTEQGQRLTADRMRSGRHVSSMPVPLADYQTLVQLQRAEVAITRERAKSAFSDMVLEDGLLDQIGPAFLSDGAIFFYGPPGTGKTSLAERMSRFFDDHVLVPRAIEVDGQLISVFDPSLHEEHPDQPMGLDPRYVLCERPLIMVGGELTLDMMDLQYDSISGLNAAPIQLLANNGILVVDDFGRQTASPDEILNRWIIPLSRGIDYLRPNTGTKFTVPFELKLVISTNLDPHNLGDDAFLRRLRNKVFVGPCTEAAFNWILARSAKRVGLEVNAESAAHLTAITRAAIGELRPYVAVDFCELAVGIGAYHGTPAALDRRMIERVAHVYFVRSSDDEQTTPAPAAPATSAPVDRAPAPTPAPAPTSAPTPAPRPAAAPPAGGPPVAPATRPPTSAGQPAPTATVPTPAPTAGGRAGAPVGRATGPTGGPAPAGSAPTPATTAPPGPASTTVSAPPRTVPAGPSAAGPAPRPAGAPPTG